MNNFINIEIKDKRKARIYTGIIMAIFFIIIVFLPLFSYQNPPPGQEGVLVSFGQVNQGQGNEAPAENKPSKSEETKPKPQKKEKVEPKPKPKAKPTPKEPKPKKVKPQVDKKVIEARNAEIALAKEKAEQVEKEKARKAAEVAERLAKAEAAAEKRRAEEEAKAIAAAAAAKKKKDALDFKNSLADSFKKGKGTGQGDGGVPGNQGDPDGDPNSEVLKGLSTGVGVIGGGLQGRGGKGPGITDNSNKTGVVVVYLCIDARGNVNSARYILKGSTTSDPQLQKLAVENAKKWNFNPGTTDETCGTITYQFKVK